MVPGAGWNLSGTSGSLPSTQRPTAPPGLPGASRGGAGKKYEFSLIFLGLRRPGNLNRSEPISGVARPAAGLYLSIFSICAHWHPPLHPPQR